MNINNLNGSYPSDRELLEKHALEAVCSCQYYDLADCIDSASDQELLDIINDNYDCDICGRKARSGDKNA